MVLEWDFLSQHTTSHPGIVCWSRRHHDRPKLSVHSWISLQGEEEGGSEVGDPIKGGLWWYASNCSGNKGQRS